MEWFDEIDRVRLAVRVGRREAALSWDLEAAGAPQALMQESPLRIKAAVRPALRGSTVEVDIRNESETGCTVRLQLTVTPPDDGQLPHLLGRDGGFEAGEGAHGLVAPDADQLARTEDTIVAEWERWVLPGGHVTVAAHLIDLDGPDDFMELAQAGPPDRLGIEATVDELRLQVPRLLVGDSDPWQVRWLPPWLSASEDPGEVVAEGTGPGIVTVPRFDTLQDGVFRRYVLVDADDARVGEPQWVTSLTGTATALDYPASTTKKGLEGGHFLSDLEELGVAHAIRGIDACALMLRDDDGHASIRHEVDGQVFHFRPSTVSELDHWVGALTDDGVACTLVIVPNGGSFDLPMAANADLVHPGSRRTGITLAFNVIDEGMRYVRAMFDFLARRYDGGEFGRISTFVIGNEVDSHDMWYECGPKPVTELAVEYAAALRVAWLAVRTAQAHGRVLAPLTQSWMRAHVDDPLRFTTVRDLLEGIAQATRAEGDFDWHVAPHPYPDDLNEPRFWLDVDARNDWDAPILTMRNLGMFTDYLRQPRLLYRGTPRRVMLTEQGFNTPTYSHEDQLVQAAAFALAYYTAYFDDLVDAYLHYRHIDHPLEWGLNLGVWTRPPDALEREQPGQPKVIHEVLEWIDTEDSLEVTDFAKSIIGISDWSDVVPGFDPSRLPRRPVVDVADVVAYSGDGASAQVLDLEPWRPGASCAAVELGVGAPWSTPGDPDPSETVHAGLLTLGGHAGGGGRAWHSISARAASPLDLTSHPVVLVSLGCLDDLSGAGHYEVMVRVYAGERTLVATGPIDPGAWNTVAIDLSGFDGVDHVERIKIGIRGDSPEPWSGHLWVGPVGAIASDA